MKYQAFKIVPHFLFFPIEQTGFYIAKPMELSQLDLRFRQG